MARPPLHDDRGRLVNVIIPVWRAVFPFVPARGDAAVRARAAAALPEPYVFKLRATLAMSCVCLYFSARSLYFAGIAGTAFTRWYTWSPLLQAALFVLTVWFVWRSARQYNREVVSSLLAAQLCPSCGYALSAIPPEPDGCSVCPECGAAWRRRETSPKAI